MGTETERWLKGHLPAQSLWLSPRDWITGSHFIHFCRFSISFTVFPQTEKNHTQYFFLSFLINSPPQAGLERMLVRNSWVSCNETCWVIYQIRGKPSTGQQEGRARSLVRQWGWANRHSTRAGNRSWAGGGGMPLEQKSEQRVSSKVGTTKVWCPRGCARVWAKPLSVHAEDSARSSNESKGTGGKEISESGAWYQRWFENPCKL